ncbi:hypothetical protein SynA1544_01443 [Synechococcus sp. A15-44]|nr:hypothetical protein SynA1544_01443 [Synechococcus sp. A15-44]
MPQSQRSCRRFIALPFQRMLPDVADARPLMISSSDVFPDPLAPAISSGRPFCV